MSTGVTEPQTTTPVDHALTWFRASLDQLVAAVEDGGLDHYDDLELVRFLQSFEAERNRLAWSTTGRSARPSSATLRRGSASPG